VNIAAARRTVPFRSLFLLLLTSSLHFDAQAPAPSPTSRAGVPLYGWRVCPASDLRSAAVSRAFLPSV